MINNLEAEENNSCKNSGTNSIAIQMDPKKNTISTPISTRSNVRNFYEFKEVLGT